MSVFKIARLGYYKNIQIFRIRTLFEENPNLISEDDFREISREYKDIFNKYYFRSFIVMSVISILFLSTEIQGIKLGIFGFYLENLERGREVFIIGFAVYVLMNFSTSNRMIFVECVLSAYIETKYHKNSWDTMKRIFIGNFYDGFFSIFPFEKKRDFHIHPIYGLFVFAIYSVLLVSALIFVFIMVYMYASIVISFINEPNFENLYFRLIVYTCITLTISLTISDYLHIFPVVFHDKSILGEFMRAHLSKNDEEMRRIISIVSKRTRRKQTIRGVLMLFILFLSLYLFFNYDQFSWKFLLIFQQSTLPAP